LVVVQAVTLQVVQQVDQVVVQAYQDQVVQAQQGKDLMVATTRIMAELVVVVVLVVLQQVQRKTIKAVTVELDLIHILFGQLLLLQVILDTTQVVVQVVETTRLAHQDQDSKQKAVVADTIAVDNQA
jgi:hypothetical protein